MAEAEDLLLDSATRHQIYLTRFATGLANRLDKRLEAAFDNVRDGIRRLNIGNIRSRGQIEAAIDQIQQSFSRDLDVIQDVLLAEFRNFADYEANFQSRMMQRSLQDSDDDSKLKPLSGKELWKDISIMPIDGLPLSDWLAQFRQGSLTDIAKEIRAGWDNGETTDQIISRI